MEIPNKHSMPFWLKLMTFFDNMALTLELVEFKVQILLLDSRPFFGQSFPTSINLKKNIFVELALLHK